MKNSTFHKIIGGTLLSAAVASGVGAYFTYNNYNHKQEKLSELEEDMSHVLYDSDLESKSKELSLEVEINKSSLIQGLFLTLFAAGVGASYFYVGHQWMQEEDNKQSKGDQ